MKTPVLILSLCSTLLSFSQTSPGAISTSIQLWLKANAGTNTTIDGNNLTTWTDQSGVRVNNATDANMTSPAYRNNVADNINYNPVIDFDGASDGLNFGNDYIYSSGTGTEDGMTWYCIIQPDVTVANKTRQFIYDFGRFGDSDYGMSYGFNEYTITTPTYYGGAQDVSAHTRGELTTLSTHIIDFGNTNALYVDGGANAVLAAAITTTQITAAEINENPVGTMNGGFSAGPFSIGHQSKLEGLTWNSGRIFDGSIAEVIGFSNVNTALDRNKIETYLAVKYGITLDNVGGGTNGDYTATSSVNIWDASVSPSYHNNIIGIGRDDDEALQQKQSKTSDDLSHLYLNTIAASNGTNTGAFGADVSYVMLGENQGALCSTVASIAEMPAGCGLYSRIEREWKASNTNFGQTFNYDFNLSACAVLGSVNVADLRVLIDDDGDFSNGGATCYFNGDGTGIVISYSNPVITISNISNTHIPSGSQRYITLASVEQVTPLPIELLSFTATEVDNDKVRLDWKTLTEINNDYFTVERTLDGIDWEAVLTQQGAGNTSSLIAYRDWDYNPYSGTSYYRLVQTDFNGVSTNSEAQRVNFNSSYSMSLYPNPTSGPVHVVTNAEAIVSVDMISVTGKIVTPEYSIDESSNIFVDCSNMAKGVYYLIVISENGTSRLKLVLN